MVVKHTPVSPKKIVDSGVKALLSFNFPDKQIK